MVRRFAGRQMSLKVTQGNSGARLKSQFHSTTVAIRRLRSLTRSRHITRCHPAGASRCKSNLHTLEAFLPRPTAPNSGKVSWIANRGLFPLTKSNEPVPVASAFQVRRAHHLDRADELLLSFFWPNSRVWRTPCVGIMIGQSSRKIQPLRSRYSRQAGPILRNLLQALSARPRSA